ncbi:fec operon regulator FecR [compost metagenome]
MKATKKGFTKPRRYSRFINKLFGNEEWQYFQPKSELSKETSEKMYAFILRRVDIAREKEAYRERFRLKLLYTGKYLAAASVITLVSFGLWFLATPNSGKLVGNPIAKLNRQTISQWKEIRNTDANTHKILLPDSSVVKLYPNTSIKFAKIFRKDSRSIYLTGKAFFEVKKDPKRPFSVYAGGLKTTALGTAFTINTNESGNRISVKLHHGKIVVRNSTVPSQPAVYIDIAGAGLIYNPAMKTAVLVPVSRSAKLVPEASVIHEGSTIIFKNTPLLSVMQVLKETYQVKISAENSIIGNTTYTGTIDPQKETAEEVLKVICMINNLTLHSDGTQEFIIKKHN